MIPSADWSFDCAEELERKAIETLEWLEEQREHICESEYKVGLQVFNQVTRGLLPQEINFATDDVLLGLSEKPSKSALLSKDKDLIAIKLIPEDAVVKIAMSGTQKSQEFDSAQQAGEYYNDLRRRLLKRGYTQLKW